MPPSVNGVHTVQCGAVQELVQVESLAQVGVQLLLFTLGLEFSLSKLRAVRSVALLGEPLPSTLHTLIRASQQDIAGSASSRLSLHAPCIPLICSCLNRTCHEGRHWNVICQGKMH